MTNEVVTPVNELAEFFAKGEGTTPPGAKPPESGTPPPPDPLAEIKVTDILANPRLKAEWQSAVDRQAANMLRGKEKELREKLTPEIQHQAELASLKTALEGMSKEELGELLAEKPELATAIAELRARENAPPPPDDATIEAHASVRAIALSIKSWHQTLLGSSLPDDKKAELDPEAYLSDKTGAEGFQAWTDAIQKAIIEQAVSERHQKFLDEEFEAYMTDRAAREGRNTPAPLMTRSNGAAPLPDLMEGDSLSQLTMAFEQSGRK